MLGNQDPDGQSTTWCDLQSTHHLVTAADRLCATFRTVGQAVLGCVLLGPEPPDQVKVLSFNVIDQTEECDWWHSGDASGHDVVRYLGSCQRT